MITSIISVIIAYFFIKKVYKFFYENDSGEPWLGIPDEPDNHKNSSSSVFDDEDDFYSYVNEDFKN